MNWVQVNIGSDSHMVNLAHVVMVTSAENDHRMLLADGTSLKIEAGDADRVRQAINGSRR